MSESLELVDCARLNDANVGLWMGASTGVGQEHPTG